MYNELVSGTGQRQDWLCQHPLLRGQSRLGWHRVELCVFGSTYQILDG
jgi:hypothetical protein